MNYSSTKAFAAAGEETALADLTVVGGAGHVGIPLVLAFAEAGLTVNINDLNKDALATLRAGKLPFIEYGAEPLLEKALADRKLVFSSSPEAIGRRGPVIITIGTPVDEFLNPVHGDVQRCIDDLLPHVSDDQLLVLRSTVYPGTTDWLADYLKRLGRKNRIAFCPERVVQGYGIKELGSMPQIVSGTTPEAEQEAADLFRKITPEIVTCKPQEAEFAKLFSNAYRYIEFAATNQFYMLAKQAGVDYQAIMKAMKTNYPRLKSLPGPGFSAGPCLFKDTMQLAAYARNQFALGHAAMQVNEGLVLQLVDDMRRHYDLANMTVGLLGMAFKAEIDDTRASLSYKVKRALKVCARDVLSTDPFVTTDPSLLPLEQVIARSDIMVLCTPHSAYASADFKDKPVIDVWGFLKHGNVVH
ncbi:nucleotide sugar dehydrogenase [Microbacteriaceae bacterium K1510]|nr:nucleotide sugar dehydrogenase [Microbacteriaceae bacterium K1510]